MKVIMTRGILYLETKYRNECFYILRHPISKYTNECFYVLRHPTFTPSTQLNLFPKLMCFFYVETHKVSTSIRGGFHVLLHKKFLEQVHSARSSCTADARPLNGFENGLNLAENRIEYVLLTTWDGNSIYFSANRARPIAKVTVKWVYRMEIPYE